MRPGIVQHIFKDHFPSVDATHQLDDRARAAAWNIRTCRTRLQGYHIDACLNDDYRVERIAAVTDVFLETLSPTVFANWMKKQGKEGGANKFPRVMKGEKYQQWEEYLKEYKNKD